MNVLVTGGAGYIGSHAVKLLASEGHRVAVLDDLSHGHRQAVAPDARLFVGNVADEALLARILREEDIEAVLHFAAFIEVGESMLLPEKYYRNNFSHALSMLKVLTENDVKKVVFSSTAAVYGDPIRIPIDENHPRQPINPYGRSKMMTEMAIEDLRASHGLGYAILRYFNVAGASPDGSIGEAHEPESHLIPRILAAARGQAPAASIFGIDYPTQDGTCVRDYLHVEDLVRAHALALENLRPGDGAIYNLGSESGFSVRQVIDACQRVCGNVFKIEEHARRPGDPSILVASSAKIRRELKWEPRYPDLETIIAHAWNWHTKNPLGYRSVGAVGVAAATMP